MQFTLIEVLLTEKLVTLIKQLRILMRQSTLSQIVHKRILIEA